MVGIFVGEGTGQDYSAMQGPCPEGFHIPMDSEWQDVLDILTTIGYDNDTKKGLGFVIVLQMPLAGQRDYSTSNPQNQDGSSYGIYWCSTNNYRCIDIRGTSTQFKNYYKGYGYLIRPFKDVAVVPDSSWTKVDDYQVATGGIYRNTTLGLISLSGDGINWITIADKNLGATAVFDDTAFWTSNYTEANCGKYYQWGNNYGFPFTGTVTTSSTAVDTTGYGPGNYYSSSTFITLGDWYSNTNNDLWGGETGIRGFPNVEEIFVGEGTLVYDYSAMRGPCPDGFHVPLTTERQAVYNIWTALGGGASDGTNFGTALKLPFAGQRNWFSSNVGNLNTDGHYWSCSRLDADTAYAIRVKSDTINVQEDFTRSYGFPVRGFKDSPVVPDNTWTTLKSGTGSAGIFWSSSLGLISMSGDGTTWITIADKNLGATTVWNSGDTLSETNCGGYFQRGNNYMFPFTGTVTTSSTQVDASNYWPGNYYNSSTFIKYGGRWDSTDNANLRGGVTGVQQEQTGNVTEVYVGTTKVRPSGGGWQPGANTVAYYQFDGNLNDSSGNNRNIGSGGGTFTYGTLSSGAKYIQLNTSAYSNYLSIPYNFDATTFSCWCQCGTVITNNSTKIYLDAHTWTGSNNWARIYQQQSKIWGGLGTGDGTTATQGQWYYFTLVNDNKTTYAYVNGNLVSTAESNYDKTSARLRINSSGDYSGTAYAGDGKLSELIFENKVRSAGDIMSYYNQTKSNYGL